ncbi:MAG: hypothetical protein WCF57_04210 [Pyrinomonadaceae bacterium]
MDEASDMDLFCYLSDPALPELDDFTEGLRQIMPNTLPQRAGRDMSNRRFFGTYEYDRLRRRATLIEYRVWIGAFDSNVKFFPIKFMESYVSQHPSMDEHYLEELDSYQRMRVLASNGDGVEDLLRLAKAKRETDLSYLRRLGLERYGKAMANAVGQGLRRGGQDTASIFNLMAAVNWLICILYMMNDEYPGTLKWRASRRFLATLNRGPLVSDLLEAWWSSANALDIRKCMMAVRQLEDVIAYQWSESPWDECKERWWWQNYDPSAAEG